ncbi:alpha/beta-hydrolase [Hesseltinella vesiculosa]|uniref:Alpha/beta-hydrolase n=1 Tax=Hesseltinella vesiculosa TaxID=101127 RepID=A0A1X2G8Q7_9FUNG|nr:alpha/beta-hydrolase [Hesseltinella vesiculosa]
MQSVRSALRKLPPSTVIKVLRKAFAMPAKPARLLLDDITKPRSSHKPYIRKVKSLEWNGCWIGEKVAGMDEMRLLERIERADVIIFNVHGGGFRIGKPTMYMDTYIGWIDQLKKTHNFDVLIMSVHYRLAPEYHYPSPVEDVVHAYEHLINDLGVNPHKVICTGDSAGASLMLEMLFITHDPSMFEIVTEDDDGLDDASEPLVEELPRPAGAVFISPIVTDESTSQSWKDNVKHDYISQYTAKVIRRDYFDADPKNSDDNVPLSAQADNTAHSKNVLGIAKLQTGFQAFLPSHVLMYIGNLEVLRDDALEFAQKCKNDGVRWTTVAEDSVHDWFCVREVVKDKKILERADRVFVDFVFNSISEHRNMQSMLDISMRRRTSEGLHTVDEMDDEEEEDDDFHETMTVDELGGTLDNLRLSAISTLRQNSTASSNSSKLYF